MTREIMITKIGYDILCAAIGAFFGASLGVVSTFVLKKYDEWQSVKTSIKNINTELNDIYIKLIEENSGIMIKDDISIHITYDTPVWEAVVKSQYLFLLQKKNYFRQLTIIYSLIKYCQNTESIYYNKECDTDELIKSRNTLYNELNLLSQNKDFYKLKESNHGNYNK